MTRFLQQNETRFVANFVLNGGRNKKESVSEVKKFHVIKLHFPVNRNVFTYFFSFFFLQQLYVCIREMH